jgi:hypothetical protein
MRSWGCSKGRDGICCSAEKPPSQAWFGDAVKGDFPMSVLTYERAPEAGRSTAVAAKAVTKTEGFWVRVFERLAEARMRQAQQYLASHRDLLASTERSFGKPE